MRDLAAYEIRRLHRKVSDLDRRVALASMPGKVSEVDAEKRLLRLEIGTDAEGQPILSPWVRWQENGVGGIRYHSQPKIGEQMRLDSPSGTLGTASLAVPGSYDDDNEAPSKAEDTSFIKRGAAEIRIKDDRIELEVGPSLVTITAAEVVIKGPKIVTDGPTHVGSPDASRRIHFQGGLDTDGDAAVDAADQAFV